MESKEIGESLKDSACIDDLRVRRNAGEKSPEVIKFCEEHLDMMAKAAKEYTLLYKKCDFSAILSQAKNDVDFLLMVSKFVDDYEEVLVWNEMICKNQVGKNFNIRHREMDIALYKAICTMQREKNYSVDIHKLIWYWPRRNKKK